jgi:ubiquinol-cytochrome c reductase cytochrome c1 subunit
MKKLIGRLFAALAVLVAAGGMLSTAQAAGGGGIHLDQFPAAKMKDLAALQNGARIFANHCLNCHSANLMRWNRLFDIGLSEAQIKEFLIFGGQKIGDPMRVAIDPKDAKTWFGKTPPDLSVIARARTSFDYKGTDYLYTLLRGYYRDAASPTGWNNIAYPSIAMPHVLWEQQGPRETTIERVAHGEGEKAGMVKIVTVYDAAGSATVSTTPMPGHPAESIEVSFKPADPARARKFDEDIADLVAFLTFMTDPSASTRVRVGVWVLIFLAFFTAAAWWLNRTFWKDVH